MIFKKCIYCKKNKPVAKHAKYCIVCYRKRKVPGECKRCRKVRALAAGHCLSCYNSHISLYKYRPMAFKVYGEKCMNAKCPISKILKIKKNMLDVDHINGRKVKDRDSIDNLQILCVWCHALKTRGVYKSPLTKSK